MCCRCSTGPAGFELAAGSPAACHRGRSFMTESRSPGPPRSAGVLHDLPATSGERRACGRAARKQARRGGLGNWEEGDRGHDALETILAQNQIRVPELVPLRHHRMAASPWNYYRGAAAVMASDLASQPHSGLMVQLCGDAHVLNFGLWATPERNLSFDLRDFDETLPGPFEWDVKRFAASLVVAGREDQVKPKRAAAAVTAGVEAYCRYMRRYATMPELDIWYDGMHVDRLVSYFEPADRGLVSIHIEKKRERRTSRGAFAKLTEMAHGRPRITEDPPIRVTVSDDGQADLVDHLLAGYRLTSRRTGGACSTSSPWPTWSARSWGWAAWGCRSTWCCWRAGPAPIRCSCKSSRPDRRSMRPTPSRAAIRATASG